MDRKERERKAMRGHRTRTAGRTTKKQRGRSARGEIEAGVAGFISSSRDPPQRWLVLEVDSFDAQKG